MLGVNQRFPSSVARILPVALAILAAAVSSAEVKAAPRIPAEARGANASDGAATVPSISSEPASQAVRPGQSVTFGVVATGTAPLTYQWLKDGAPIAGATSPAYTIAAAAVADSGAKFSVTVSGPAGSVTSDDAILTVNDSSHAESSPASAAVDAQPARTSRFLSNAYIGVHFGYIAYAFSNAQLQPGFEAQTVQVPHSAVRFVLLGHEFNKYLSGQVTELIPLHGVTYENVNGNQTNYPLWMNNIAGFTVKGRLPLNRRWSLYGEGGLGVVTRNGFTVNGTTALNKANYPTFLYGGGLDYRVNENWDILTGIVVAPGHSAGSQPTAEYLSGGFDYTMRDVPAEPVEQESPNAPIWPRNFVHVGYITNGLGYGVNNFFTTGKVAIFWHGSVEVANGLSLDYQRNIFHTRRLFAIDWGVSVSTFKSRIDGERFFTASLYPVLRVPIVRTNPVEAYFSYSLAGPALLTRTTIDGQLTGKMFTFQDYMALGTYLGRKRKITGEVRIGHYSNANLFSQNPGITIPLGFYFGTTF